MGTVLSWVVCEENVPRFRTLIKAVEKTARKGWEDSVLFANFDSADRKLYFRDRNAECLKIFITFVRQIIFSAFSASRDLAELVADSARIALSLFLAGPGVNRFTG